MSYLEEQGYEVITPMFDSKVSSELDVVSYNRALIESADEIYLIWDGRSIGTIFDLGMVFALRKPLHIWYLEERSIQNVARMMAGLPRQ